MNLSFRSLQERLRLALPAHSLRARFARGAFWSLIGTAVSQGLGLLSSMVTARLLGKTGFGELGMILSTLGVFGVLAGLSLGMTATKHVAEFRAKQPERAGRIIGTSYLVAVFSGGATSILLYFLTPYLAVHTINAPHLAPELQIACGILFFSAVNGAQFGALTGFEAFRLIAKINFFLGLATLPTLIVGVYFWQLPGAVWSRVAVAALGCLITHLALRREAQKARVPLSYHGIRSELPMLWNFSLPAVLSGAVTGPALWAANALLVNQPNGYAELGVFSAANQWRTALHFIPIVLGQATTPMLSSIFGLGEKRSALKILAAAIGINFVILLSLGSLLALFSPWIMAQYGQDFRDGWPVLIACLVTAGLYGILTQVGNVLVATGKMWVGLAMNMGWATVLLGAEWFLVQKGAWGLSLAYMFAYLAHTVWVSHYAYVHLVKGQSLRDLFPMAPVQTPE